MSIDTSKPLANDGGFPRVLNIVYRMYPLLDGFTLETAGLYAYLKSWRNNSPDHRMYGKSWLNQREITAQTKMSAHKIRLHAGILERYGLLRITKSRKVANKKIYETLEPITEAQFRALYPAEIERFSEELRMIDDELEADRERMSSRETGII